MNTYRYVIGAFLNSVTIPPLMTWYSCPFKVGADEIGHNFPCPTIGILSDLTVRKGTGFQPEDGELLIVLQIRGSDTGRILFVTHEDGEASKTLYNELDTTPLSGDHDWMRWRITNFSPTLPSCPLTAISMMITDEIFQP